MSSNAQMTSADSGDVYQVLETVLKTVLPKERVITDPSRLYAYGTDASMYRLTPKIVVRVEREEEVLNVLRCCRAFSAPVTFRGAGTGLAGQSITDSVLMVLGDGWDGIKIEDDGKLIRLQPGVIGSAANRRLAALARKIGPDPASIDSAYIGGMAANNSSGMCCGTTENSYQTLQSMRVILADGAILDTSDASSRKAFALSHANLLGRLDAMAKSVKANQPLAERISRKYRLKNTTGYSLNALVDFEDPIDILQHLMIGSEGTLGFIAEIGYRTVVELPKKASALVVFPDIFEAARIVSKLVGAPTSAVELLDYLSIKAIEQMPGMPESIVGVPEGTAALLIETRALGEEGLNGNIEMIKTIIDSGEVLSDWRFTSDPDITKTYWNVRKVVFPAVAGARPSGTTVIIEDVAFRVEDLAEGVLDLQRLFAKHNYQEAVIYGHARDGNMHFVIYQDFSDPKEVERYRIFMDDICDVIVKKYDGSLKAEHGTGRNMAPYVALEWGEEGYELMRELKRMFDPENILNPGVIINDDHDAHLKNFKAMPLANTLIDNCTECGFCESLCPSNKLTFSPRQRITVWREISRLKETGSNPARLANLTERYAYDGMQTCAACSMCSTVCPMSIDTGSLIKTLRIDNWGTVGRMVGSLGGRELRPLLAMSNLGLGAASAMRKVVGDSCFEAFDKTARKMTFGLMPKMTRNLPTYVNFKAKQKEIPANANRIVYFPSCAIRSMGPSSNDPIKTPVNEVFETLAEKAGFSVVYPKAMGGLCCGQPWDSQGLHEVAASKATELEAALMEASEGGKLTVVFDTSTCTARMKKHLEGRLRLLDVIEFLHDEVLPKVDLVAKEKVIVLHTNCSAKKMGLEEKMFNLAKSCSEKVVRPEYLPCCGFAGTRGFTTPELNEFATRRLREQVPHDCHDGYSSNRTCEIGLADQSGIPFRSVVHLVAKAAGL